jgi:Holliday junction resolvase RusA-like endonuclease
MADFSFTVFGRPQGKGSKHAIPVKGRYVLVDSNKLAVPYSREVKAEAGMARLRADYGLMVGPVAVELDFYFDRPAGHFGTGRNSETVKPSAPRRMIVKPDIDKLARTVLDALTGIAYRDDSQVAVLQLAKHYGSPERLEVKVVAL